MGIYTEVNVPQTFFYCHASDGRPWIPVHAIRPFVVYYCSNSKFQIAVGDGPVLSKDGGSPNYRNISFISHPFTTHVLLTTYDLLTAWWRHHDVIVDLNISFVALTAKQLG